MASTQPIALPTASSSSQDWTMSGSGSYRQGSDRMRSGSGSFNPASYTRQFLGSPLSWRPGSGSSFSRLAGTSPGGQLLSSLALDNEFKMALSTSFEATDRGSSMLPALNVFDREADLCRNYTCCGQHLTDLHALIEHFEDQHIVVDYQTSTTHRIPFHPHPHPPAVPNGYRVYQEQSGPFDPDDMELELDVEMQPTRTPLSTPPDTPPTYQITGNKLSVNSSCPPQIQQLSPVSAFETMHVSSRPHTYGNINIMSQQAAYAHQQQMQAHGILNPHTAHTSGQSSIANAIVEQPANNTTTNNGPFNTYSRFSSPDGESQNECVPPELLYASSSHASSPASSASPPPNGVLHLQIPVQGSPVNANSSPNSPVVSVTPSTLVGALTPTTPTTSASPPAQPTSLPSSTRSNAKLLSKPSSSKSNTLAGKASNPALMLQTKPFRCPKPNCNKSYKQANGLKYHMTHGSCNFTQPAPPSPLAEEADSTGEWALGENEQELREHERNSRPFACGVGECSRRYKNMNGLRYHYAHSGDHGAVGMSLLASGMHPAVAAAGASSNSETKEVIKPRKRERERERGTASGKSSRAGSMSRGGTPVPGFPSPTLPSQQFVGYSPYPPRYAQPSQPSQYTTVAVPVSVQMTGTKGSSTSPNLFESGAGE